MDNPLTRPTIQGLSRPQVFVKVEFGVSWSAHHAPRKHGIEWKSRALRDRAANFPRRVPAPTTNYLAAASVQQFHQNQNAAALPPPPPPPQYYSHQPPTRQHQRRHRLSNAEQNAAQQNLLPPESDFSHQGSWSRQVNFAPNPEAQNHTAIPRRRSRATVRSPSLDRHDRGHSAPPPLSDNNWDVVHSQQPSQTTAYATTSQRPVSDVWKDLPELPSKFRLGEDELPWEGTWAFPMGWEPFLEPDPYLQPSSSPTYSSPHSQSNPSAPRPEPVSQTSNNENELPSTPTVVKIESPIDSPRLLQNDPARRSDLEALGSAMMTVDNGFESQWWNQGKREAIPVAMHPPETTSSNHRAAAEEQMALGWVGALLPPGSDENHRFSPEGSPDPELGNVAAAVPARTMTTTSVDNQSIDPSLSNMIVSPVSSYSGPVPGLNRALSTRSDELWFSSPRYA